MQAQSFDANALFLTLTQRLKVKATGFTNVKTTKLPEMELINWMGCNFNSSLRGRFELIITLHYIIDI